MLLAGWCRHLGPDDVEEVHKLDLSDNAALHRSSWRMPSGRLQPKRTAIDPGDTYEDDDTASNDARGQHVLAIYGNIHCYEILVALQPRSAVVLPQCAQSWCTC